MTSKGRFAFVLVGTLAFAACADDEDLKDTRPGDGDVSDVIGLDVDTDSGSDTGSVDMDSGDDGTIGDTGTITDTATTSDSGTDTTVATDTGTTTDTGTVSTDTGTTDTGTADTGTVVTDTGTASTDTGPFDTGSTIDTGPFDTGSTVDTGPFDTGSTIDTGPFDTGSTIDTGPFDTGSTLDSVVSDIATLDTSTGTKLDATADFSRSITIDGTNDFTPQEKFATTSGGYNAYVTWDASYVYVGYEGTDIGPGASSGKWVIVHIDGLTGAGSNSSEVYGMQQQLFPAGFDSDLYFAWKSDGTFSQLKTWNGVGWITDATPVAVSKSGSYVEMAIPLAPLGPRTKLGVTSYMINEGTGQWTYAGLYIDSFIDGFSDVGAPKTIAHWVDAFSGTAPPNDPTRKKP